MQSLHDDARHFGMEKNIELCQRSFLLVKMVKEVEQYVKLCEHCTKRKTPPQTPPMTPIQATHQLQFVTMVYLTVEKAMGFRTFW